MTTLSQPRGINEGQVTLMALLYLALPSILFFLGWLTPVPAILASLGVIGSLIYYTVHLMPRERECVLPLNGRTIAVVAAAFILICLLHISAGLIGFFPTDSDYDVARQAYYVNLVEAPWPIVLPNGCEINYYIAAYLPPAILARIFAAYPTEGSTLAQVILLLWTAIGYTLAFLVVFTFRRKASLLFVLFVIFLCDPLLNIWFSAKGGSAMRYAVFLIQQWSGIDCSLITSFQGRHTMLSVMAMSGPYNSLPGTLLSAAVIICVRKHKNFTIPLTYALLLPISPMGAVGCLPFVLCFYAYRELLHKKGFFLSCAYSAIPLFLAFISFLYFTRGSEADGAGQGLATMFILSRYGVFGSCLVYGSVLFALILMYGALWPLRRNKAILLTLLCILLYPLVVFGVLPHFYNELWLKCMPVYTFILSLFLAYEWKSLPRWKYIALGITLIHAVRMVIGLPSNYTGDPKVEDRHNGNLANMASSKAKTDPPLIEGIICRENGAAEKNFPGNILPKAPGFDYSRPPAPRKQEMH